MLKNATMDGGPMTNHLVKVRALTDPPKELEKEETYRIYSNRRPTPN